MSWLKSQVYLSLVWFFLSAAGKHWHWLYSNGRISTDEYDAILEDNEYKTLFAVAIGYRDKDDSNQPTQKPKFRLDRDKVIRTIK